MSQEIDYYFDFSSSYSYIAQSRIPEIESKTGCAVVFRPMVLGAIFQQHSHSVPAKESMKMQYFDHDLQRCANDLGIEFGLPLTFPFNAMHAMRVYYAIAANDLSSARQFANAAFKAAFAEQKDLSDPSIVEGLVNDLQLDYASLTAEEHFNQAKLDLKENTGKAMQANVFGAPSFVYQNELYWGADRIDMLIKLVNQANS